MATAVFLTLRLGLPLLLEGEPGVGKTAAAQVLARRSDAPLVRLQCYEGLSASEALYDWNHQRQLLAIRVAESQHERIGEADLFSEEFLVERPILRCIRYDGRARRCCSSTRSTGPTTSSRRCCSRRSARARSPCRSWARSRAVRPPIVVLTSNRSRDLHDALRRRCLYHWLEYPEPERVVAILRRTAPVGRAALIESAAQFVGHVRALDVDKPPGVAEAINWVAALAALGATELVREVVVATLGRPRQDPGRPRLVLESLESYAFG